MSELRLALCHAVRSAGRSVADVARDYGVSRKTAYKWLARFDAQPNESGGCDEALVRLRDRSRRPHISPRKTCDELEKRVLAVRDEHGWGPRKIHALLRRETRAAESRLGLPGLRTIADILRRNGRLVPGPDLNGPIAHQRFERPAPNQLWQLDHKGPVEIARTKWQLLTVLDDHSRYLLNFCPMSDRTMATTFCALWNLFGEVGLPEAILCDNAFGVMGGGVAVR